MTCPYCGCACVDGRYAAAQQQAFAAQQQAFTQQNIDLLHAYNNAQHQHPLNACRFFEDNPQLSGWQESAKEWSKIP